MMVQSEENIAATVERHYQLEERHNGIFAVLKEVNFTCKHCKKSAYVDMTLVPVHTLPINCPVCDRRLFILYENKFEQFISPTLAQEAAFQELVEESERMGFYQ